MLSKNHQVGNGILENEKGYISVKSNDWTGGK
jgi:hypothetical protein